MAWTWNYFRTRRICSAQWSRIKNSTISCKEMKVKLSNRINECSLAANSMSHKEMFHRISKILLFLIRNCGRSILNRARSTNNCSHSCEIIISKSIKALDKSSRTSSRKINKFNRVSGNQPFSLNFCQLVMSTIKKLLINKNRRMTPTMKKSKRSRNRL